VGVDSVTHFPKSVLSPAAQNGSIGIACDYSHRVVITFGASLMPRRLWDFPMPTFSANQILTWWNI